MQPEFIPLPDRYSSPLKPRDGGARRKHRTFCIERRAAAAQLPRTFPMLEKHIPAIDAELSLNARRVGSVGKLKTARPAALAKLDALFASPQHRAFCGYP